MKLVNDPGKLHENMLNNSRNIFRRTNNNEKISTRELKAYNGKYA